LALGYGGATFSDKNVGNAKAIGVSGISLTGADAGNYVLVSTSAVAYGDVTARTLTVGATASNKVYDGGVSAAVSYADDRLSGDLLTVSGSAAFADKDAGNGKVVTVNGLALSGTDAGNYVLASGSTAATADIAKRSLTASVGGASKVYDGNATAVLAFGDDRVAGDALLLSGSGAFSDKNAGNGKAVTASGISLAGADAGNYQLTSTTAAGTGSITPRALTATVAAADKVYDGTTATSVTLLGDDRVAGDQLVLGGGSAAFADKNAGSNKAVSLSGVSVAGADAGNYTVSIAANSTASITPRALQVSATGVDKVYDGSLAASVTYGDDRLAGDILRVGGDASFADKNVGKDKAIGVSRILLSGADAGNYVVGNGTAVAKASITPKALTAVAAGAVSKVYDGTTSAQIAAGQVGLAGFAGGEGASVGALQGQYNSANVAGASSVKAGIGAGAVNADAGTALSNYVLPAEVALAGSISARQVSIGGVTVAGKTYDGGTNASLANIGSLSGMVNGESLNLQGPSLVQFDNRNAGSGKTVTASGYSLADGSGLASNYALESSSVTATGAIAQAQLVVKADDQVRAYGGSNPALTWTAGGFLGGDSAALLGDVRASTSANRESAAGSYAIEVGGGSLANYAVNYVNGVMTVERAPQQIDNIIGNTVNPTLPGQGGGANSQSGSDDGPLVAMPAAIAPVNGNAGPLDSANQGNPDQPAGLEQLLQRLVAKHAANVAASKPGQGDGETRETAIGGGSRVRVRDGGVNGAVAPN
jgi:hypothetical protein